MTEESSVEQTTRPVRVGRRAVLGDGEEQAQVDRIAALRDDRARLDALEGSGVRLKVSLGGTRWFTVREPVRSFVDRVLLKAEPNAAPLPPRGDE